MSTELKAVATDVTMSSGETKEEEQRSIRWLSFVLKTEKEQAMNGGF